MLSTPRASHFLLSATAAALFLIGPAPAGAITITANENGNCSFVNPLVGTFVCPASFIADPGPGGLASVLNYNLLSPPGGVTAGDVVLTETALTSDVIRFSAVGNGSFFFYSDLDGGADTIGDKGLPGALNTNVVSISEVSLPGIGVGATYTPTSGQPGFVSGFSITYTFVSDTPEPSTALLLFTGFAAMAVLVRRNRQRHS
jgi:hypothetical protein